MRLRLLGGSFWSWWRRPAWRSHGRQATAADPPEKLMRVLRTDDFAVDGKGGAPAWQKAEWQPLQPRGASGSSAVTRVKMLYSSAGLYVLMDGEDRVLTATMTEDFLDLWNEDVFEFFLWPDERHPVYFEYEISPLGYELPILIPNFGGQFLGWRPWHYDGKRRTQKAVAVRAARPRPGPGSPAGRRRCSFRTTCSGLCRTCRRKAGCDGARTSTGWTTTSGQRSSWDWARVGRSFHEFEKFGTLVFE